MAKHKILFYSHNGPLPADLKQKLETAEIDITTMHAFEEVPKELASNNYDLYVDRSDAISAEQVELIRQIRRKNILSRVILSTKSGQPQDVVNVMKAGASDVVIGKTMDSSLYDILVANLKTDENAEPERVYAKKKGQKIDTVLIGRNKSMEEVNSAIELVANSQTAVLITGESGTGKEMVARTIHLKSDRANNPFIAINCAAFPKDVIENELFGHEKGAFTGALIKKAGCFELANGGTLFFDEIAEMSPETQAKLLRVIEYKSFRRLGGNEEIHVDVRMIAATNKKIRAALKSGEFREDLYYRFSVIEIGLPPLRERKDDIPLLLEHFVSDFREKYQKPNVTLSDSALKAMMDYDWPGNVRELRNIVERMVVTCPDGVIDVSQLPPGITNRTAEEQFVRIPIGTTVHDAEKMIIQQTLAFSRNNKSKAARVLGVSRKTLHNKLSEYGFQ